ncbi:MAG: hypothetical protein HY918_00815 [Candidatus Doudnabacteria bacterium]|nr:hypothetical protein [Candidatus Doudnabacteria bacterium]
MNKEIININQMNQNETGSVCPSCGYPNHAGHASDCALVNQPKEKQESEVKKVIKTGNVDLSKGYDSVDKIERFVAYLKKQGLEAEKYLYSGFAASDAKVVAQTGTYSKNGIIFCAPYSELTSRYDNDQNPLLTYAAAHEKGAVAMYNPEFLEKDEKGGLYGYRLKKEAAPQQAIEAIIKVKVY